VLTRNICPRGAFDPILIVPARTIRICLVPLSVDRTSRFAAATFGLELERSPHPALEALADPLAKTWLTVAAT
jgi:hypothetical protein